MCLTQAGLGGSPLFALGSEASVGALVGEYVGSRGLQLVAAEFALQCPSEKCLKELVQHPIDLRRTTATDGGLE